MHVKNMKKILFTYFLNVNMPKKFWATLLQRMKTHCNHILDNFNIPKTTILLGISENFYTDRVFNLLLLMAKMFIYRQKVNSKPLSVDWFLNEIKERYYSERHTAILKNRKTKLDTEWKPYLQLLQLLPGPIQINAV